MVLAVRNLGFQEEQYPYEFCTSHMVLVVENLSGNAGDTRELDSSCFTDPAVSLNLVSPINTDTFDWLGF